MIFPYSIIDLTHVLSSEVPTWDESCGFEHLINCDYDSNSVYKFRAHKIHMSESIGTHIDAPAYCIPNGHTIEELSLENLIAPCVVIDVSAHVHERYTVSVSDITKFEEAYGQIEARSFVMIRTGWEQFWHNPEQYKNNYLFPSLLPAAAELLVARQVVGIGIDTLSPDRPEDGFPVHNIILGNDKYIVENVANSAVLPPVGCFTLALPIKTKDGTEAPIRLIALLPKT